MTKEIKQEQNIEESEVVETMEITPVESNLISNDLSLLNTMGNNRKTYVSLDMNEKDNKIKLYNAMQKCDVKINDIKEQTIEFDGVFVEYSDLIEKDEKGEDIINELTGEVQTKAHFRTILFGTDGNTYVSSAYGVYNSIRTIIGIFGTPAKDNVIKVKVGTRKMPKSGYDSLILTVVNE